MKMTITRRLIGLAAVAAIAMGVAACGGDTAPATTEDGKTVVRVAAVQGGVMPISFRAGVDEGIFAKHGLDVQITTLATGADNIAAVVEGSADIGYSDVFGGASARKSGFDIGMVTPENGTTPLNYILVAQDSEVRSAADLAGKNIGIGAPPLFKTLASINLVEAGVDPESVNFTLVKDQTSFGSLLKTGQVDAILTTSVQNAETWISDNGFRNIAPTSTKLPTDRVTAGWWATWPWYEQNTGVAEKFAAAVTETHQWFAGLPSAEVAGYVKEQTKADAVELEKKAPGIYAKLTDQKQQQQLMSAPVDQVRLQEWFVQGERYAGVPQIPFDELLLPTATGAA